MFKFNFSNAELDAEERKIHVAEPDATSAPYEDRPTENKNKGNPVCELSLDELTQALPPVLSYSPLFIPLSKDALLENPAGGCVREDYGKAPPEQKGVTLSRRDLFDARYQLIVQDEIRPSGIDSTDSDPSSKDYEEKGVGAAAGDALAFVDNSSDLVPGVYEGGLKTWECSLDLVDCLASVGRKESSSERTDWVRGKRVLELGCGTAVPSLYLLHTLFSSTESPSDIQSTELVLQDYNDLVLRLVTFPNVLLTWYASPLAEAYRSQRASAEADLEEQLFDLTQPGDLHITPELLSAFRASLQEQRVSVRFVAGSWQAFSEDTLLFTTPFDVILTSETIYQVSSLPSLIGLLRRASMGDDYKDIQTLTQKRSLDEMIILVAAKVLYFGVGGGVMDFECAVKERSGRVATVLQRKAGVGRKVMRIDWTAAS